MSELSEVGQLLHEEHFRFLVSICGLQNRVGEAFLDCPLDPGDAEERKQLEELIAGLDEVIDHHRFEEANLFPLIRDRGDGDLVKTLLREHVTIEPKASHLRQIAAAMCHNGVDAGRWSAFRKAADELIADMMLHLEKEEESIVQRLSSLLDAGTDRALALRRTAQRRGHRV